MKSLPTQPDLNPDDFITLEMIGGSLDGRMMPVPLPLPHEFLNIVRPPRTAELYEYQERKPTAEKPDERRVVYVYRAYVQLTEDAP